MSPIIMRDIDNLIFGDIALAELPYTDGSKTKIRPVLILTRDKNDYLLMKITSITDKKEQLDIEVSGDYENNLEAISVIKVIYFHFIIHSQINYSNYYRSSIDGILFCRDYSRIKCLNYMATIHDVNWRRRWIAKNFSFFKCSSLPRTESSCTIIV